jgi:N-succinyldiaminopimelate aminotransferase
MAQRTLTISSSGKTFSLTGWKVGWACGPERLVQALMAAKQFLTYTSGAPLQPAIAAALGAPDAFFADLRDQLQARRDQLAEGLTGLGFDVHVPQGTYFLTTDIRSLGFDDGLQFCLDLPAQAGVVAIPHQVFYDDKAAGAPLVRWAFCKRPDVIDEALTRLARVYG